MNAPPETPPAGSRCARCGARFECGLQAGAERCWCAELPPLEPAPGEGCLCPACLRAALAAQHARGPAAA
ncbi:MAG TPA: cysteine-rich CWC family protein [Burkholderiales bacterium]|nr:cysteine-rich CWC family protein [Burkholderiales bacterium]